MNMNSILVEITTLYVTVTDLDRALYDLKRRLQRNKDTFQPASLIVGSLVNRYIKSSYVIVNDQKFKVDSCGFKLLN